MEVWIPANCTLCTIFAWLGGEDGFFFSFFFLFILFVCTSRAFSDRNDGGSYGFAYLSDKRDTNSGNLPASTSIRRPPVSKPKESFSLGCADVNLYDPWCIDNYSKGG